MSRKQASIVKRIARSIRAELLGRHRVTIHWEGNIVRHTAYSMNDAMEWVSCYPKTAGATIVHYPVFSNQGNIVFIKSRKA